MGWAWVIAALAACAHTGAGGGSGGGGGGDGGFRVFYPDTKAKVGKHFQAKPSAECKREDGTDARWSSTGARVESGELAPGLVIEDAAIGGIATKPGTYSAKITVTGVTCAGKPQPDQTVDVTITVR
jgi:hypothetical protein